MKSLRVEERTISKYALWLTLIWLAAMVLVFSSMAALAQTTDDSDVCGTPAPGASNNPGTAEWVIRAQTQAVPKLFEHECFKTRSIVKSSVDYFRNGDEARKIAYEDLWFHEGKTLGLERKALLDLPQDKTVEIQIKSSPCPSILENKAAAGTILRLVLDLKLNRDLIEHVTVPFNAFNDISTVLQSRDFHALPAGQTAPPEAAIVLNLQSDQGSAKQTLYYSHQ